MSLLSDGRVEFGWDPAGETYLLEEADSLNDFPGWRTSGLVPAADGSRQVARTVPGAGVRFYRLRRVGGALVTLLATSPDAGEGGIAVTRETVFQFSGPLAPGTVLEAGRFRARAAGRTVLSRAELAADRRSAVLYHLEQLPSGARVEVTLDGDGLADELGRPVDFDADGVAGGAAVLVFETVNTTSLAGTAITGRVLASEPGPGGVDVPLAGVTITVDGQEETLRTTTAADGSFRLEPCPAGRFFVNVDGRTAVASRWPDGAYYPVIGKAWEAEAGRTNNLAGGTGIIYLPLVAAGTLQPVSDVAETRVTFPEAVIEANPALAGVEILVPPNGLFADNGTRGGLVGLAPVASDRLPEPLPAGLTHTLDISIQTSGPQNFAAPVPAKFPNLPDPVTGERLPPGAKTALWSFNHDTGRWEMQGPMTVTPDGMFVITDDGVGIRQPGWHGTAPGTSGSGGPGGGDCTPGTLLAEGTSQCVEKDDCPEEPADADRQARLCFARGGACALKCYEDCGTAGRPGSWLDFLKLGKDCRDGAICSKECLDRGKECKEKFFRCVTRANGGGASRMATLLSLASDPLVLESERVMALTESITDRWLALGDILDRAPTFEELVPADQAVARQLATEMFNLLGGEWPSTFAQAQLRRLHQAALRSALADDFLPPVRGYYVIEDLDSGLVRRGRTEPRGILSGIILRAETPYRIRLLLGPGLSYHERTFTSAATGRPTDIPYGAALPFSAVDADADGIPAEAEFVLGTRDDRVDTDGDGVADLVELRNHTNPLDGVAPATGVVASIDTPGNAMDLAFRGTVLVVADGAAGVAVIDVAEPLRPRWLQQIDTPGTARAVAVEGDLAAVADGAAGLAVINLAVPAAPVLLHQVVLGSAARAVAVAQGVAYLGLASGEVVGVDLLTGSVRLRHRLSGNPLVEDLRAADGLLYVWAAGRLDVLRIGVASLEPLAGVASGAGGGQFDRQMRLTLGPGRAYGAHPTGVAFFDISQPGAPVLLANRTTAQNGWKQLVPVLPGLALAPDGVALVDEPQHHVSLYRLGPDGTALDFQARFDTPGVSRAVVVDRGMAFAADGPAGVQVIHFAPVDTAGVAPEIALAADFPLDPASIESGQRGRLTALVTDDVMVREVEFLVDGVRVGVDGGWPFEFPFIAPERTAGRLNFRLQVRAVDIGGNVAVGPEVVVEILPDQTPPRLVAFSPRDGAVVDGAATLVAFFDEPLAAVTVGPGQVRLTSAGNDLELGTADDSDVPGTPGYDAAALAVTFVPDVPLPPGRYRFTVGGLADLAGNVQAVPGAAGFFVAPGGPDGDADEDGLTNAEEGLAGTNPFEADTDGDGWADEVEVSDGTDPRDPASRPQFLARARPGAAVEVASPVDQFATLPVGVVARPFAVLEVLDPVDVIPVAGRVVVGRPPFVIEVGASDDLLPVRLSAVVARPSASVEVGDPDDVPPARWVPAVTRPSAVVEVGDPADVPPFRPAPVPARPPVVVQPPAS